MAKLRITAPCLIPKILAFYSILNDGWDLCQLIHLSELGTARSIS